MERIDTRRWRWRMRGAWQWPVFIALTVAEAFLLVYMPVWGNGPEGGLIAAGLLAACMNLIVVAVLAPAGGLLLRTRRRDLPRAIAADSAGAVLLFGLFVALVIGGLGNREQRKIIAHDHAVTAAAVRVWVRREKPAYEPMLGAADTIRLNDRLYRGCVPGPGGEDPWCVFVNPKTGEVRPDRDRLPNSAYGRVGNAP